MKTCQGLLLGCAYAALACPLSAIAQTAPTGVQASPNDATTETIADIVVTARKKEERLQNVPLAITALTTASLESRSITSSLDLQQSVPSLQIGQIPNAALSSLPSIRGQVQTESLISVDPSVGTYVNNVYVGRTDGAAFNPIDIQRIEVVKGPQGTLFGRNTTGGAISVFTNRPDPEAGLSGWLAGGYGTFNRVDLSGVLNVPLSDTLAARFVGQYVNSDGYIRDIIDGKTRDGRDDWLGRASLRWQPSKDLDVLVVYEHYRPRVLNGPASRLRAFDATNLAAPGGPIGLAALETFLQGTVGPVPLPIGGSGVRPNPDIATYLNTARDQIASGEAGFINGRVQSVTANIDYKLGDGVSAKLIYGWRKFSDDRQYDLDGTPALIVSASAQFGGEQHSVEGQLLGQAFGEKLDWVTGAYYFTETGFNNTQNFFLPLIAGFNQADNNAAGRNKSYALFAQGTFELTSRLRLTGGLRHTWDEKSIAISNFTLGFNNPAAPVFIRCEIPQGIDVDGPDPAGQPGSTQCLGRQSRKFGYFSYLASLDYRLADDVLGYAKISQATRGGGFNVRAGRNGVDAAPFNPETIREIEVGLKSTLLGGKLRLNLAGFYTKGSDLQVTQQIASGGSISTLIQNAAKATFKGVEVEATWRPTKRLTLDGSLATLAAHYDRYLDGDGVTDLSSSQFRFTSDAQLSEGITYRMPTRFGSLAFFANGYHVFNYRPASEPLTKGGRQIDYTIVNLRAEAAIGPVTLAMLLKNATDDQHSVADFNFLRQALGTSTENVTIGRTWGAEVKWRF
ncbi:TonB-dependent receptor [Novosphingobium sp.]|uniref:TonB-dependent receptor n=1 Tax=Novosphingobium sp. TaxID=1874826 RepID=UPI003BAA93F0